jgi:hypothetical protein
MTPQQKEALIADAARQAAKLMRERLETVGERALTVDEIEDLVEEVGREVDSWLEERLIAEQAPPAANTSACPNCHQPARYKETRETPFLTTHGWRSVRRRYHYCARCQAGFCPLDAVLGLEEGRTATRRIRAWQARYGAQEGSFAAVPPILAELRGLTVSESTVERTTVEVGTCLAAAQRLQAAAATATEPGAAPAPAPPAAPERLYLAMDGTMCPLRERWRKDGYAQRAPGKLKTRYGEAKVGMVFTTGRKDGLDTGITARGCVATLGNIVSFTLLMVWLARQWGAHQARELIVLGDGAAWIWKLARQFFPQAVQILDYWHVIERLFTVAEARFGSKTSEEAKQWVTTMRCHLENDFVDLVVSNIKGWQPRLLKHRKLRDQQAAFLHTHRDQLQYGTFLAQGYLLGSGPIEARCKQVAQSRLHEAGMHWREHTAEAVLALRAFLHGTDAGDLRAYA